MHVNVIVGETVASLTSPRKGIDELQENAYIQLDHVLDFYKQLQVKGS